MDQRRSRGWVWVAMVVVLAAGAVFGARPGDAAEGETGTNPAEAPPVQVSPATGGEAKEPYVLPPFWKVVADSPHNKLVHFPVALGLTALLFFLLAIRRPALAEGARILVLLGALSTIPVYFAGVSQSQEFMNDPKQWLMLTHRSWGIATAVGFWLWTVVCYYKPLQKYAWVWGIVMAGAITVTAMLGGLVANG